MPHHVDPDEIVRVSGKLFDRTEWLLWGIVQDGDWDRSVARFDERPVPRAIRAHYRHGTRWAETSLHDHFEEEVQTELGGWGHASPDDFESRVGDVEALYRSIRDGGYRSKRALATRSPITTNEPLPPILDEITVDVGRDGSLLWRDCGQHRLAIAKTLDLDEVPVLLGAVHAEYDGDLA